MIADTPPGFTAEVIATIDASSDIVMVGTLDSLSLKNTKLGLETLGLMDYDESKIQLVLNRADTRVGISQHDVVADPRARARHLHPLGSRDPACGQRGRSGDALAAPVVRGAVVPRSRRALHRRRRPHHEPVVAESRRVGSLFRLRRK